MYRWKTMDRVILNFNWLKNEHETELSEIQVKIFKLNFQQIVLKQQRLNFKE